MHIGPNVVFYVTDSRVDNLKSLNISESSGRPAALTVHPLLLYSNIRSSAQVSASVASFQKLVLTGRPCKSRRECTICGLGSIIHKKSPRPC